MKSTDDYIVVFITASSVKEANLIADALITGRLAACVNTTSINSLFIWKKKHEKAKEVLLIVKTKRELFEELEGVVRKCHSYEVPEIIAVPIIAGSRPYLDWIRENTR